MFELIVDTNPSPRILMDLWSRTHNGHSTIREKFASDWHFLVRLTVRTVYILTYPKSFYGPRNVRNFSSNSRDSITFGGNYLTNSQGHSRRHQLFSKSLALFSVEGASKLRPYGIEPLQDTPRCELPPKERVGIFGEGCEIME